jgi:SAM-dependent methyltransferase
MGIDNNSLRFILDAKNAGANFSRTLTIGRQNYYRLTPQLVEQSLRRSRIPATTGEVENFFHAQRVFCDGLFTHLGAQVVDSLDYSPYEGATVIHDMNTPIPDSLHNSCTVVIDGGSLEHIFNFPVAIGNCMRMVKPGGHFIGLVPANNFFGHGFYQFSAELYYRVFAPENGFEVRRMVFAEDDQTGRGFFEVVDPAEVRSRVTVATAQPCHLVVFAEKKVDCVPFKTAPYQSDYVRVWEKDVSTQESTGKPTALLVRLWDALKRTIASGPKEWLRTAMFPGPRAFPGWFRRV